ncbi:hypothetical protein LQ938_00390 [Microbacterium sp. cx-55]|uniref:hypothetical protein n=1 Tax=Microbacterium sp. cx-55 TaxID=2875948 RepID=UPI001CC1C205|nr:hypothetical protein [Microbacterium sp. cx-55]MBZ4487262.1 hypothetical protein [Microbacterium sp. cx-55]UGB35285.1 hypothetical protein LQ938_00390 [Microbacterium sp. cx-55]
MEPLFEFLAAWWWTGPTTVGLAAAGYAGVTTGRRRARRLALDAARHEEGAAARALMSARAQTRAAQAQVFTAQAQRAAPAPGVPSVSEARRALQQAKLQQKAAALALKASRTRVRAERAQLSGTADALPLERLMQEHDAITARWLEYETDVETAIAFPQMTDARHPATAAFLQAQRETYELRPASASTRISAERFAAYRQSIRALEVAFTAAEDAAMRTSARRISAAPDAREAAPRREDPPSSARPESSSPEPEPRPERTRPVWPVPGRSPRPPAGR